MRNCTWTWSRTIRIHRIFLSQLWIRLVLLGWLWFLPCNAIGDFMERAVHHSSRSCTRFGHLDVLPAGNTSVAYQKRIQTRRVKRLGRLARRRRSLRSRRSRNLYFHRCCHHARGRPGTGILGTAFQPIHPTLHNRHNMSTIRPIQWHQRGPLLLAREPHPCGLFRQSIITLLWHMRSCLLRGHDTYHVSR